MYLANSAPISLLLQLQFNNNPNADFIKSNMSEEITNSIFRLYDLITML